MSSVQVPSPRLGGSALDRGRAPPRRAGGPLSVLLVLAAAGAGPIMAQPTPYVPNLDPAYADLDALVAVGLVREVITGERPYSRAAFARFATEAAARAAEPRGAISLRAQEAIARLERRFGSAEAAAAPGPTWARVRRAQADLSAASSPARALRTGADGSIDGNLNPLLQVNQGRDVLDGSTLAAEAAVDVQTEWVAALLRPRLWIGAPSGPESVDASASFLDAHVRSVFGPVAVELGRNHVALGHGGDGGPMLSHNARGLDMLRLSADRPVRLPGPVRVLGLWQASAIVAHLGDDRDRPGSILTVLRLSNRLNRFVELGMNVLNLQGGGVRPDATFGERLRDVFLPWTDTGRGPLAISDKIAGADVALTIPALRTKLYSNVLTTDDRGTFQQPAGGLWEDAIWLVGAQTMGVGPGGRFDVRIDWTHAGARAHTHQQFTSGMTLDGRVLGSPLGPNATAVQGAIDWTGRDARVSLAAAWERYSGDDFAWGPTPGGIDWWRVADNPDEIRRRLTVDWTRLADPGDIETRIRVGYERVTRFSYTDENRSNIVAQVMAGYAW